MFTCLRRIDARQDAPSYWLCTGEILSMCLCKNLEDDEMIEILEALTDSFYIFDDDLHKPMLYLPLGAL